MSRTVKFVANKLCSDGAGERPFGWSADAMPRGEMREGGSAEPSTVTVWIGSDRKRRLAALKAAGASMNVSKVCQDALDKAMTSEEQALTRSRIARVLARLRDSRPPEARAFETGERAGRLWAEEIATLSEMRLIGTIRSHAGDRLSVLVDATQGGFVSVTWRAGAGEDIVETLPSSVPFEFFRQAQESAYRGELVSGFIDGASLVHDLVERALERGDVGTADREWDGVISD